MSSIDLVQIQNQPISEVFLGQVPELLSQRNGIGRVGGGFRTRTRSQSGPRSISQIVERQRLLAFGPPSQGPQNKRCELGNTHTLTG